MITEAEIKLNIQISDRWLYRAILAIYDFQTAIEQSAQDTIENNGVGFNGVDGRTLSGYAKDIKKYGSLFDYKKVIARKKMLKYSGQLIKIARQRGK